MRIANSTIARNYTAGLHNSMSRLYKLSERSTNFRRFDSFAENTAGAVRAMNVRNSLAKLETNYDNIKTEVSRLTSAESSLTLANEIVTGFYEKFLEGAEGSTGENRADVAVELNALVDQLVTTANAQFSDKYLFGGSETKSRIWNFDKSVDPAVLTYRNLDVTRLAPDNPELDPMAPEYDDDLYTAYQEITRSVYVDIGLGLQTDASGNPLPGTTYETSLHGLDIFGVGEDNIILQMHKMATMMKENDGFDAEVAGPDIEKLLDLQGNIRSSITEIGSDYSYLKFSLDRLDSERINLQERQKDIEAIDPEIAIMDMKMQEYAYNASLQMGGRILQGSVFDYIR